MTGSLAGPESGEPPRPPASPPLVVSASPRSWGYVVFGPRSEWSEEVALALKEILDDFEERNPWIFRYWRPEGVSVQGPSREDPSV